MSDENSLKRTLDYTFFPLLARRSPARNRLTAGRRLQLRHHLLRHPDYEAGVWNRRERGRANRW